jgi:hypothetical protein
MNIQSFLPVDYNRTRKAEVAGLVKKWEKIGLLEGLSDERQEKSNVAILLENQAKQLVVEANRTGTNSNSEEWAGVALPLVRRVFTEISAKDFVSVQPMNLPTGLVFFLDFKYGTAQGGFQTGSGRTSQADSVFGVTDARRGTPGTGGLYGAGRFSYTSNDVTKSLTRGATVTTSTYTTSSISTTAAWNSALNYDSVVSSSLASAGVTLKKVTVATGSLSGLDIEAIRAFAISGSGITTYYPAFTKLNASNNIEFIINGTATNAVVTYTKQPTSTTRGDFEAGQASATFDAQLDIPEINLELRSEEITAKTRKLKTKWSDEFAQDLNAYHSLDAEAELTAMLSEYISHEIDLEILDMLIKNAQTVDFWSAKNNEVWDGTKFVQQSAGTGGYYNSQGEWFQTLGTKLQKVSNEIHRLVLKGGGANFMVCSPTVSTVLESIPGYAANTDGTKMEYAMGVQKIGTINSRYTVYKNPYMTENTILLGYRGSQFLETGAVYAPYIPIMMTPTVLDPENFTPRKGIQTRYAKKMVRPEFYGKIYVGGLETI